MVQAVVLVKLPYTTSSIRSIPLEAATTQAESVGEEFVLGPLRWNVDEYVKSSRLEPFRRYFLEHCGSRDGLDAALCLSDTFAAQFPFGSPRQDFFSPGYDLLADLERHTVQGEPGHCVTRSGLSVATLLSVGIPARVVQIIPPTGSGHTVVSVWDGRHNGWVLFDPSYGGIVQVGVKPAAPLELLQPARDVEWRSLGLLPPGTVTDPHDLYRSPFPSRLIFPEPWLYMREGTRTSTPLARGTFVVIGRLPWLLGPVQQFLRWGISLGAFTTGFLILVTLFQLWHGRVRNAVDRRDAVPRA